MKYLILSFILGGIMNALGAPAYVNVLADLLIVLAWIIEDKISTHSKKYDEY